MVVGICNTHVVCSANSNTSGVRKLRAASGAVSAATGATCNGNNKPVCPCRCELANHVVGSICDVYVAGATHPEVAVVGKGRPSRKGKSRVGTRAVSASGISGEPRDGVHNPGGSYPPN